MVGNIVTITNR